MAFNINPGKQQFSATAAQTVFTFNFAIFAGTDLKVYKTLAGAVADDTADILILSTHYTVSINGTLGGTVTLLSGASLNDTITVVRSLPIARTTDYVTNGDLYAEILDLDQDYQTYLVLDQNVQLERAIIVPESLASIDLNIPAPVANSYLRWNVTANALENDTSIPDDVVTTTANVALTNADVISTHADVIAASASATSSQLRAWEAEAEKLTADSYATEPENVFVKTYVSDGDGTFTATNTSEYSALHWSSKALINANFAPAINSATAKTTPVDADKFGIWDSVSGLLNSVSLLNFKNTIFSSKPPSSNFIMNGGFNYWNYATSQTTSGYGSDDRWNNANSGSTKVHSRVASTDTERALFNSPYFSRTVVTSVAGASNRVIKYQFIENITKLAGKTVTISFWAKADTTKNIALESQQIFGSGGVPSATISSIGSQLIALTTSWQKKTITVTLPSIIGKTIGTDGVHTSSTGLFFWFDAGSDYSTRTANLGQQSGTFDIAQVQLEEGSVATPWTPYEGEFGGEVQACQRYYEICGLNRYPGYEYSANVIYFGGGIYKATKRVVPTILFSNYTSSGYTPGAITTSASTVEMFSGADNTATLGASGQACFAAYSWTASAEL